MIVTSSVSAKAVAIARGVAKAPNANSFAVKLLKSGSRIISSRQAIPDASRHRTSDSVRNCLIKSRRNEPKNFAQAHFLGPGNGTCGGKIDEIDNGQDQDKK